MDCDSSPLLTDLYQLTMIQGYVDQRMHDTAVFEFFIRTLPPNRGFFMAAGLEQLLDYLESLRFSSEEVEWLAGCGRFNSAFVDYVRQFRFTGDVHAVPEGTIFFPNEPIVRITAPMPQAQLVETRVINLLHFQTLIASKAVRSVLAAPGRLLVDFGLRRAHGSEAGLLAARAGYLAGLSGSSTVLAEQRFGVPAYGTMAHSFVEAHDDEAEAFAHFAMAQPRNVVLLIDTYDTEAGARKVVALADRLQKDGISVKGVRLDSGDLADHARKVRCILDEGGLSTVQIFASGSLDEFALEELVAKGAPIGGFGIGTRLITSADAPYLDCAYKLQEYAGRPRRKRSEGKATWPGRKQIFRRYDDHGMMQEDVLTVEGDRHKGEGLIVPVMRQGQRLAPSPPLMEIRDYAATQVTRLPEPLRQLRDAPSYPVIIADALTELAKDVDQRTG